MPPTTKPQNSTTKSGGGNTIILSEQEQQVTHEITTDLVRHSRELANTIIENLREPLEDFIISEILKRLHEEIELDENIN